MTRARLHIRIITQRS